MSELNGFNSTSKLKRDQVPPIVIQVLSSEYLILAATLSQHGHRDVARLVVKRIQEIARGARPNLIEPTDFKEKLAIVLKDLERRP